MKKLSRAAMKNINGGKTIPAAGRCTAVCAIHGGSDIQGYPVSDCTSGTAVCGNAGGIEIGCACPPDA